MAIKTYKAKTSISINVVLPSKKNMHVSFVTLSDGSSTFITDSEELQNSIERHYNFGKLFKLVSERNYGKAATKQTQKPKAKAPAPVEVEDENVFTEAEATKKEEEHTEGEENSVRKVNVTDIAAAKDYLADTFGISRTAMRNAKAILQQAAEHGIEFEGL